MGAVLSCHYQDPVDNKYYTPTHLFLLCFCDKKVQCSGINSFLTRIGLFKTFDDKILFSLSKHHSSLQTVLKSLILNQVFVVAGSRKYNWQERRNCEEV